MKRLQLNWRSVSLASAVTFLVAGIFFLIFFVYPIGLTLKEAFYGPKNELTLEYVSMVFIDPLYVEGLINSLRMAVFSTLLAVIIAVPLALLSDRFVFPGQGDSLLPCSRSANSPPFCRRHWECAHLLGKEGSLNTFLQGIGFLPNNAPIDWLGAGGLAGVVVMNALHLYPIIFLNVTAALANLDPAMDEAAQNLGCPSWKRIFRITLPLIMPGIFAGLHHCLHLVLHLNSECP